MPDSSIERKFDRFMMSIRENAQHIGAPGPTTLVGHFPDVYKDDFVFATPEEIEAHRQEQLSQNHKGFKL